MRIFRTSGRRWRGEFAAALASALVSFACAGQQAAHEAAAPEPASEGSPAASPDTPAPASQAPASAESSAANSAAAPAPETPPEAANPTPVELCNAMCDRVTKKCSENAAESCRMNCTQYEHPPAGCDAQVRVALECAAKAEDLTCVNIAPESCALDFRRVVACSTGKPEGAMPEDPTKVPEGWERFEVRSLGFSAPMPKGVAEKSATPPTFAVTAGDASYQVRVLEPPKDSPTQKNLVKVAMGLLGKCQKNLKLFSMVERPGRVSIRFQSGCPGGTEIAGLIAIASGKMYVLEVNAPKDSKAPKDPFFYNFEVRS